MIGLTEEELQGDGYDLHQHVLEKNGMTVTEISCFNPKTDDLEEARSLSPDSFAEGEDPEDGSGYLAAQVLIEYEVLDGYRPVLQGNSAQLKDPYGVMPLTSFEGGNIKDITFVPADVLTVRLEYKYSPTGGLAGMDAADSQVFQIKVDDVKRDEDGNITAATPFTETWDLPCYDGTNYPTLEGFRIVLDPTPLNAFLNDPVLAAEAMKGNLSQSQIQKALENDSFSVNTNNANNPVYEWQAQGDPPPDKYEDYTENATYQNRYSTPYNEAWDDARSIKSTEIPGYTAQAVQKVAAAHQGANPLTDPQLTVTMTAEQCAAALDSDNEIKVTVYYRRNSGFYHVAHWVPKTSLSQTDVNKYTKEYLDYNKTSVGPFDQGYLMVCLERKQGRVGALTNARANPPEAERILSSFLPRAVNQKTIEANTRVDILYDTADRYGLIFQTEESYIPRQYVNKGYTVTFTTGGSGSSAMQVKDKDGKDISDDYKEYKIPTRQGYTFAGWKYEVRSDVTGSDVTIENGKKYKTIKAGDQYQWNITEQVLSEAVVIRDSDRGDAKMIYLYPVWTPDMANVRVVFWTEDLGGEVKDVDVDVTIENGQSRDNVVYLKNLDKDYLSGTPTQVGNSFSNVGSFTFMAPTNSTLDLSMKDGGFSTTTQTEFTTTGESVDKTGTDDKSGTLVQLINAMFQVRMPDVATSTTPIDSSEFYHPHQVEGKENETVEYTVAPDGSTIINVYYARNVYTLDFTYYGEITQGSGTKYDGPGGLAVATNTTGYSSGDVNDPFQYDYQKDAESNKYPKNRWQLVAENPQWTVPQTLTISAKYDADLREVWPLSRGEEIGVTLQGTDLSEGQLKNKAVFMSWGTTAGPFNQHYRKVEDQESTIIGSYRSMSADIIADAGDPDTIHHLVGYWWNQNQSYYRRNACYEVPGLTAQQLFEAVKLGDVTTFDLTERTLTYDNHLTPDSGHGTFDVVKMAVSDDEKVRRDTVYLIPVEGSSLDSYFEDYRSNFIVVDENGEPDDNGKYYAVRRIGLADDSKVYALGRQAISVSTNYILAQAPSTMPSMTSVSFKYGLIHTWEPGQPTVEQSVTVDHDTQAWDDWGRTAEGTNPIKFIALGAAENPYDIWFYYDRARFEIIYMVASRNSTSGEYEIGRHETIYGQNMKRYNLDLKLENGDAARMYSNDEKFKNYWTPADNSALAPVESSRPSNGLNDKTAEGYTRLCPDSAVDGKGAWECKYWSLDRSGSGIMYDTDWNRMVTGNLRVFAQWTPPQYKVKFDFNGGSYNGSETFPIQTVKANVGYTSSGKSIPSPTRDGYVFNGWTWYEAQNDMTAGTLRTDFTFETPVTRDMVLKANWTSNARTSYNYKIWYLTDDENAGSVDLPNVEGEWLTAGRGTPQPDAAHQGYKHVLGCQYVGNKALPEDTVLSLSAVAIPGYAPLNISTTLALDENKNGTGVEDTGNVVYFYYQKSQVKSYTVRFQLWDKTGDEGILTEFTTNRVIADSTYFTPGEETWRKLKDGGYYLVQMNAGGTVKTNDGEPVAARTYQDLSEFVNSEIKRFDAQSKGTNMTVTFKVAPYFYTIQYHVGAVKRAGEDFTPSGELKQAMQAALDNLAGEVVQTAVVAGKNPTRYVVADFNGEYSFMLKNPAAVQDPDDASKEWRFTGWSPAPGTNVISRSRSVAGEYPTLEIERSEGDLEFLANWELADRSTPSVDPENSLIDPRRGPETGDHGLFPWGLLGILSLSGLAVLCLLKFFHGRREK